MRNKLTVPWTSRLVASRLFHWRGKAGRKNAGQGMLKEDDLDHLGSLHAGTAHRKSGK